MGNQSTSDKQFGTISIWTEKTMYVAGEQVNGVVNVELIQPFPSTSLFLIVEGKEKSKVVYSKKSMNPTF